MSPALCREVSNAGCRNAQLRTPEAGWTNAHARTLEVLCSSFSATVFYVIVFRTTARYLAWLPCASLTHQQLAACGNSAITKGCDMQSWPGSVHLPSWDQVTWESCRFSEQNPFKERQSVTSSLFFTHSLLLPISLSHSPLASGSLMCSVMPDNYLHYLLLLNRFTHKHSEGVVSAFNYLLPPTFP